MSKRKRSDADVDAESSDENEDKENENKIGLFSKKEKVSQDLDEIRIIRNVIFWLFTR